MLESTPDRTLALVVGVDHYEYGEDWRLTGPASDALRCVDWLIARKVKAKNIALFLSKKSWKDDPEVAKWVAANKWKKQRNAARDEIVHFVDKDLPGIGADALFVYWGGHGVVDDFHQRNYLYTEDAAQGTPYCVCVQDLVSALHGERFKHLAEQVTIIDACAEAIFKHLNTHQGPGWPDFLDAFDSTLTGVEALKMGMQQPFMAIDWPGEARRRSGRPPGDSAQVRSLLTLIEKTVVAPALLYRLYLRLLADSTREVGNTSIEHWLRDLDDSRPRTKTYPTPLTEFAERLGRELKNDALKQWVIDIEQAGKCLTSAQAAA